jgi:hypothetical protein
MDQSAAPLPGFRIFQSEFFWLSLFDWHAKVGGAMFVRKVGPLNLWTNLNLLINDILS